MRSFSESNIRCRWEYLLHTVGTDARKHGLFTLQRARQRAALEFRCKESAEHPSPPHRRTGKHELTLIFSRLRQSLAPDEDRGEAKVKRVPFSRISIPPLKVARRRHA